MKMEMVQWEIYVSPPLGHRIWLTAEVETNFVRIHIPHIYIVKHKEENGKDYDGNEYYTMRSMTGQILTLTFTRGRQGVVQCSYSYAVANERLAYDRIFYPLWKDGVNLSTKNAKKWLRDAGNRLLKRFWKDNQHGLCEGKEKFKEFRQFIDKCFEVMENER